MRKIFHNIFSFFFTPEDEETLEIVSSYRDEYRRLDKILLSVAAILSIVHEDLSVLSTSDSGRESDFTTENLFRAILVMQIEGLSFRETTIRIAESETLQKFCRLVNKKTIDHTLLCRAFQAIQGSTWEKLNQILGIKMKQEGNINTDDIRTDTTVTESDIHYPTDSSLLWDVYRTLNRLVKKLRKYGVIFPELRIHLKKIKKLHLNITRFSKSKNKKRRRWVQSQRQLLIERVNELVTKINALLRTLSIPDNSVVQGLIAELKQLLPIMEQIVNVAERNDRGEKVPVGEKVLSLFEPHTELIMRGRREKPVEFGHKILISETREKFITDFHVFEHSPSDSTLLPVVIERHQKIFGTKMKTLSADMGFCSDSVTMDALTKEVKYLAVPRRLTDLKEVMLTSYQCFRAGIEGTISCLKRVYRLSRCCYHGFKGFCKAVGSAIFCHNLVIMAEKLKTVKRK